MTWTCLSQNGGVVRFKNLSHMYSMHESQAHMYTNILRPGYDALCSLHHVHHVETLSSTVSLSEDRARYQPPAGSSQSTKLLLQAILSAQLLLTLSKSWTCLYFITLTPILYTLLARTRNNAPEKRNCPVEILAQMDYMPVKVLILPMHSLLGEFL